MKLKTEINDENIYCRESEEEEINEVAGETKEEHRKSQSMIKSQDSEYHTLIDNQYTIFSISDPCYNINEIKTYSTKKIEGKPIQDKQSETDHQCFPHIFIEGTGGLYAKRPFRI
jgi:hypothetical protein